ncbi:MAG: hypothetical protein KGM46_06330 [Pseudomonadota bacterium]|nr:hypothetical protein [Xanthomonadaceae bacterium]MDE3210340.1 hypothetical protein [Pseudomonadota bacterium]
MERDGKASARAVAASFKRHIFNPWPKLATKSAHDVALDDLLDVVALVAEQGKLNEARKLRSYLKAAFSAAVRARQDARSAPELRSLRISANPARDIATIDGASKPGDRALTVGELRYYWTRISGMRHPKGALLRFHLLTGAQRIAQLGRVVEADPKLTHFSS